MTRRFSWIGDDTQRTLKRLAMSGLTGLFVAGAYALLSPSWYTARISVVSLKRSATPAIPGLAELRELGGSLPGVPSSDAERIAAVLSSESVANAVIDKFDLKKRYGKTHIENARKELWQHCAIRVIQKGELVALTCEDKDPAAAQAMVAFFGEHGNAVFRRVDAGSAGEEVHFLEGRLAEIQKEAREAQQRLRSFEEANRIVDLESQAKAVVSNIAAIRAQRVAKELELSYAKGFASREESSSVQLRHMLSVLEAKERALEGGTSRDQTSDGGSAPLTAPELLPPAMAVPSLRAQLEELHLDRKFYETAELMTMQRLETAKANQAREISTFQILDAPTLPTYPSRPRILMVGLVIGLVAGAAWLLGPAYIVGLFGHER